MPSLTHKKNTFIGERWENASPAKPSRPALSHWHPLEAPRLSAGSSTAPSTAPPAASCTRLQPQPGPGAVQTPRVQPPNPRAASTGTGAGPGNSPEPASGSSRWVLRGPEENSRLEEHLEVPVNTHQMLQGQLKRGRDRDGNGKLQMGGAGAASPPPTCNSSWLLTLCLFKPKQTVLTTRCPRAFCIPVGPRSCFFQAEG